MTILSSDRERVIKEIDALPAEYLPFVLQLVRTLHESVTLKSAAASLRQGWKEAQQGQLLPIAELWNDLDVE